MKKARLLLQRLLLLGAGMSLMALPASATTNLIHRYSFGGAGPAVIDSIAASNGVARVIAGSGGSVPTFSGTQVTLDGTGGYIDLPNGMVSGLTNVTFEFWFTWDAGGTWTRLLDFGIGAAGEDPDGTVPLGSQASNYVFVATTAGATPRFAITPISNGNETQINSFTNLSLSEQHYLVVTYGPARTPSMYIDGNAVGSGNYNTPLSVVRDVNDFLGRSLWQVDSMFGGSFNEFRMHSTMLSQLEVLAAKFAGPDAIDYTPENPTSITLNVISNMTSGTSQDATLTGVFPTYGTVIIGASEATNFTTSNPNIVAVGARNRLTALNPGTATITAMLGGQSSSADITVALPVAFTALRHRYSFNESAGATTAIDSIAAANATVVPPTTSSVPAVVISNGVANFPGGGNNARATCGYITLPSLMLSTEFTNFTVEMWFTWTPGGNPTWQRVFDFGDSNKGNDPHVNNTGRDYIMFTPQRNGTGQSGRTETRMTGDSGVTYTSVNNDAPNQTVFGFPTNQEVHVVCTVAPGISYSALYIDGILQNINTTPVFTGTNMQLAAMSTPNMWLGVSQWFDPPLAGRINEFRMYEGILNSLQIALSRKAGPNALPVADPGTLLSLSLSAPALYINNPLTTQAILLADFQNVTGVDITSVSGVTLQSTDTNIFRVSATGAMTPVSLGTASLIASYQSLSATTSVSVLAPTIVYAANLPATLDVGDPATTTYTVPLLADFPGPITGVNVSGFTGVTRSSSDTNVATITAAGVVTVRNPGTTTITGTYWDKTNNATLTVLAPISVLVTNLPATLEAGSVNYLVPLLANYSDGHTNVNVTAATGVTRSSSDANVATIANNGVVTVRNPGVTTITSTYQGKSVQATLTVVFPAGFVRGTLLHRYSLSEAVDTTTVTDSVGTTNGDVAGVQFFGQTNLNNFTGLGEYMFGPGPFQEPPQTNSYLNLPNGLISGLSNVTVEGWFTWRGGSDNQRVFDFGMSSGSPDGAGGYYEDVVANPGRAYFFLSPQQGRPRFAMKEGTGNETPSLQSPSTITITTGAKSHFAIVYDKSRGVVRLYVNGQRANTGAATLALSVVDDRNDWLGRSQWGDPYFNGSIDEFRIYDGPFLDSDIADHFSVGPNVVIPFRPRLSVSLLGSQVTLSWPTNVGSGYTLKSSTLLGAGAVWNPAGGAPTVVGENYQVTVPLGGGNAFFRLEQPLP